VCSEEKIIKKIRETEREYLPLAEKVSPIFHERLLLQLKELRSLLER
jgi:hypothetical protein